MLQKDSKGFHDVKNILASSDWSPVAQKFEQLSFNFVGSGKHSWLNSLLWRLMNRWKSQSVKLWDWLLGLNKVRNHTEAQLEPVEVLDSFLRRNVTFTVSWNVHRVYK